MNLQRAYELRQQAMPIATLDDRYELHHDGPSGHHQNYFLIDIAKEGEAAVYSEFAINRKTFEIYTNTLGLREGLKEIIRFALWFGPCEPPDKQPAHIFAHASVSSRPAKRSRFRE